MKNKWVIIISLLAFAMIIPLEAEMTVKVQRGETAGIIAKKYLKDAKQWREVFKANDLPQKDPPAGTLIKIPSDLMKSPDGVIVNYQDAALYSRAHSKQWDPSYANLMLFRMDSLKTNETGQARLTLRNKAIMHIGPKTTVILNYTGRKGASEQNMLLKKGRLRFQSSAGLDIGKFQVLTPAAVAGVRGTEFETSVDDTGNTGISCYKGKVGVSAAGKTVEVPAGFGVFVEMGKEPGEPFALPQAPI
ncbi:MAG: FecR domain-containing protein [Leptospirales bacterium]|jgi:hypothetical protein